VASATVRLPTRSHGPGPTNATRRVSSGWWPTVSGALVGAWLWCRWPASGPQ
jgi:hypothetical protein